MNTVRQEMLRQATHDMLDKVNNQYLSGNVTKDQAETLFYMYMSGIQVMGVISYGDMEIVTKVCEEELAKYKQLWEEKTK